MMEKCYLKTFCDYHVFQGKMKHHLMQPLFSQVQKIWFYQSSKILLQYNMINNTHDFYLGIIQ